MELLNNISTKDLGLYANQNSKLQEVFLKFKNGAKFVFSWKALVFAPYWLAYHRLYKESVAFVAIVYTLQLIEASGVLAGVIALALWVTTGFFGLTLLVKKCAKEITQTRTLYTDNDVAEKALMSKFKTSKLGVFGVMIFSALLGTILESPSYALVAGSDKAKEEGVTYTQTQSQHTVTTPQYKVAVKNPSVSEVLNLGYDTLRAPDGTVFVTFKYGFQNRTDKAISSPDVSLLDANDTSYSEDFSCTSQLTLVESVRGYETHIGSLNPSTVGQDLSCFKVAKEKLKGEWFILINADKNVKVPITLK